MKRFWNRVIHRGIGGRSLLIVVLMVACAAAGVVMTLRSHAATSVVSAEVEKGTISTPAAQISDTSASAGSGVAFKAPQPATFSRFPGDPNPKVTGKAYWGEAYSGNGDVASHMEAYTAGKSLSLHRTYWNWQNKSSGMISTVKADLAADRLPFVSVKTPSWTDMANGKYDSEIDTMLKQLDATGGPVWLTVWHEPEGGGGHNYPDDPGGAPAWRAMQKHIRDRMNAVGTKHIAFMPILMAWTFDPSSGRNPEDWWVPGIWDAYIVDTYNENQAKDNFTPAWNDFVSWAEKKGMPYGIAEWGNRGTDATTANEMRAFWDWGFKNKKDMIAYTYFDSSLNSPTGGWQLTGQPLVTFRDILANDPRVMRISDLR